MCPRQSRFPDILKSHAIVDCQYIYRADPDEVEEELYDLVTDPWQQINLINSQAYGLEHYTAVIACFCSRVNLFTPALTALPTTDTLPPTFDVDVADANGSEAKNMENVMMKQQRTGSASDL